MPKRAFIVTASKTLPGRGRVSKDFEVFADTPTAARRQFMKDQKAPASAIRAVNLKADVMALKFPRGLTFKRQPKLAAPARGRRSSGLVR